jgi:hypothetical protein
MDLDWSKLSQELSFPSSQDIISKWASGLARKEVPQPSCDKGRLAERDLRPPGADRVTNCHPTYGTGEDRG